MVNGLWVTTAISLAGAVLFLAVGTVVARRSVSWDHHLPNRAFAAAWIALGLVILTDAVRLSIGLWPQPSIPFYLAMAQAKVLFMGTAIGAFIVYVSFLHTGRTYWPVAAGIAGVYVVYFLFSIADAGRGELRIGEWATRLPFTETTADMASRALGITLFFVPVLAIVAAYSALHPRIGSRSARWRHAMVSVSLLATAIAGAVQANPAVDPDTLAIPVAMVVILISAIIAYWSFAPPAAVARVTGMRPLKAEPVTATSATKPAAVRPR